MKHTIRHDLPAARAKAAGEKIFSRYSKQAQLRWTSPWSGEVSFVVAGISLRGTFQITTTTIDLDLPNVPASFLPLVPAVKVAIDREASRAIAEERRKTGLAALEQEPEAGLDAAREEPHASAGGPASNQPFPALYPSGIPFASSIVADDARGGIF